MFFKSAADAFNNSIYKQACVYMYVDSSLVFLRNLLKYINKQSLKKNSIWIYKEFLYTNTTIRNLRHKWHVLSESSMVSWLVLLLVVFYQLLL